MISHRLASGIVIERVFYRRLTRSGGGYTVAGMGMIICGFGMSRGRCRTLPSSSGVRTPNRSRWSLGPAIWRSAT